MLRAGCGERLHYWLVALPARTRSVQAAAALSIMLCRVRPHSPVAVSAPLAYYKQIDTKHFLGADKPLEPVPIHDPEYTRLPWAKMGPIGWGAALLLGPLAGALLVGAAYSLVEARGARQRGAAANLATSKGAGGAGASAAAAPVKAGGAEQSARSSLESARRSLDKHGSC
jgi:hypothetical protein